MAISVTALINSPAAMVAARRRGLKAPRRRDRPPQPLSYGSFGARSADNDSREIFRLVHARLAQGENAAAALRHAQLQAMAAGLRGWQSVAVMTNRIQHRS